MTVELETHSIKHVWKTIVSNHSAHGSPLVHRMRLSLSHNLHKDTTTGSGKQEECSYSLSPLLVDNLFVIDPL